MMIIDAKPYNIAAIIIIDLQRSFSYGFCSGKEFIITRCVPVLATF